MFFLSRAVSSQLRLFYHLSPGSNPRPTQDADSSSPPGWHETSGPLGNPPKKNLSICQWHPGCGLDPTFPLVFGWPKRPRWTTAETMMSRSSRGTWATNPKSKRPQRHGSKVWMGWSSPDGQTASRNKLGVLFWWCLSWAVTPPPRSLTHSPCNISPSQ